MPKETNLQRIKTKDGNLEVYLFKQGTIEIESKKLRKVSIKINVVDPTDVLSPLGAIYRIELYDSEAKSKPFEYDSCWIMHDGTILKRGQEYSDYMRKHPRNSR